MISSRITPAVEFKTTDKELKYKKVSALKLKQLMSIVSIYHTLTLHHKHQPKTDQGIPECGPLSALQIMETIGRRIGSVLSALDHSLYSLKTVEGQQSSKLRRIERFRQYSRQLH